MRIQLLAATAALLALTPLAASAQSYDPSYADNDGGQQIRGRIIAFDGQYDVTVRDDQGYVDNVELHNGTILNPTGITLEPGMSVSIIGFNDGSTFAANEVDTPYNYDGGVPYYQGHPWSYYGPSIDLGFFFGSNAGGWWRGAGYNDGGAYRSYHSNTRVFNSVDVTNVNQVNGERRYPEARVTQLETQRSLQQPERNFQPARRFAAQQQPERSFAPQQVQTRTSAPQQQAQPRSFVPQAGRGAQTGSRGGGHERR